MTIAATTAATQTAAASTSTPAATGNASALASDFDTFLQMLSVQMKNQDPLNPTDSTEFASQLAQFSTVEQQTMTNTLLSGLAAQFSAMGMSDLASWVGMEARVTAPANFTGEPIEVMPNTNPLADSAFLIVRDSAGNDVQKFAITPGQKSVDWAGIDDSGVPFDDGLYTFVTESYSNSELLDTVYGDVYARVNEARNGTDGVVLIAPGGVEFAASDVISLRAPS